MRISVDHGSKTGAALFKTLEDIGTKLTADVLERQGGRNVKTRLDAVDLHKPKTTCSIL